MKKIIKIVLCLLIVLSNFMPFKVKAASSFSVEMVSNTSSNKVIGTYTSYSAALSAMNSASSSNTSVATIYKNGVPVDSKYAIFKLKPGAVYSLYASPSSSSAYTSVHASYGTDSALLGYDDASGRVKIKISGFTGWTSLSNGVVTPISLIGGNIININESGVRLRSAPTTGNSTVLYKFSGNANFNYTQTATADGYTWYKINYNGTDCWVAGGSYVTKVDFNLKTNYTNYGATGNLIHNYEYYSGGKYVDYFTNLGPAPSYLTKDVTYYSFDGNYFYSSLTKMLDDYRSNTYSSSVNKESPHYPYYMYLTAHSTTGYTANDFNKIISNKGYTAQTSKLYGSGEYFIEAQDKYGANALLSFSAALNESNWGTSTIAMQKNNLFGYGAADSCPVDCAYSYNSVRDSILDYASKIGSSYSVTTGSYYFGGHFGNKASGKNVKYATDPYMGEKSAMNAYSKDKEFGLKDYNANTLGVSKKGLYNIKVYKDASLSSNVLYTMKNKNTNDPVYDFSVNIVDKVSSNGKEFYKIYTDLPNENNTLFGYVEANSFNVSNHQPIIEAHDKIINLNSNFDYLSGVSASDYEDGNLTSKIKYNQNVNTSKIGTYQVTYTVTDKSNFSASKTINVEVKGAAEPVIKAEDKEVSQYTSFDYLNGVEALDDLDGDITNKITYSGNVDTSKKGEYKVTYTVTNSNNKTTTKTITVKVVDNEKPVINAEDKTIILNKEFNPLDGVKAYDKEDGEITDIKVIKNEVKIDQIGQYTVIYEVTDSTGQKTTKEITVNVILKTLKKSNGWFHLEELSFNENKMHISGFEIITGISNSKNDEINYKIKLVNQDDGQTIESDLSRWTNNTPFTPNDGSKNDYSGAWFSGDITLNNITQGDYTMYITASGEDYYAEDVISNIEYSDNIQRKYEENKRGYLVKENKVLSSVDLELFIRDEGLISYGQTATTAGLYNDFFSNSFEGKILNITGSSYALKTDYSKKANVEREIILENAYTHKIEYKENIGYIDNGPYKITSYSNNDLTRAWFNAKIDVSNLKPGKYIIYIKTKTGNSEDYAELVDYAYSDFESQDINGKKVYLKRNSNQRIRVELVIE